MAQHFLLSASARALSLKEIYAAGEDAAYATFRKIRWAETDGEAICPRCGCCDTYTIATRRKFKCKGCAHQFGPGHGFLRQRGALLSRGTGGRAWTTMAT